MKNIPITTCLHWKDYVTPKLLRKTPIHRWLVFPHSFAGELVNELVNMWGLTEKDCILDPFAGAGTTMLSAKELNIPATGFDISPFSVFVSNAKTANYDLVSIGNTWAKIKGSIDIRPKRTLIKSYPALVRKALHPDILNVIEHLDHTISYFSANLNEQLFFRLALFKILPEFSQAKASGGWLKWIENKIDCGEVSIKYSNQIDLMIQDLSRAKLSSICNEVFLADARNLPKMDKTFSAVITSPPYPNRHDYTRIFGVELMYGFLDWKQTCSIRYQSIHSHPESKPIRPNHNGYKPPKALKKSLSVINKSCSDNRVKKMLEGYFIDLYCCFKEIVKVINTDAKIAIVLGNAQYYGEPLYVDEIAAGIGEQVGLTCTNIITARMRGNSAQQMGIYGRNPSRESIILFNKQQ